MMKRLLTIVWLCIAIGASAQTPWNKQAVYTKPNGLMPDSVSYVPRTKMARSGLYLGAPVGDSGRIAYSDKYLWLHVDTGWRKIAFSGDVPFGVLDSARRSNDTLYFRSTSGGEIAVKLQGILIPGVVGLQDSLNTRLSFSTRLTPLVTGANLPIQPTDSLTQALAKLQAQINAFDGTYIKLISVTPQPAAAGYIQGRLNIKGNSGNNFGMMMERASKANDDIALGWKSETDTVGYLGLVNKGLNHITLYNLKDNLRFGIRDTARMEFITLNANNTGRIGTTFWNGKWNIGDSLPANDVFARYPIDVISTQDTSARFLHKVVTDASFHGATGFFSSSVTGVTESLADSTKKFTSTEWVRQFVQSRGYVGVQDLQSVTSVNPVTTNRIAVNTTQASTYSGVFTNTGTGLYHGLYVNISSGSTGNAFRVDKNGIPKLVVDSAGVTRLQALSLAIRTVTGATTLDDNDGTVLVNNSGSATITLPNATGRQGRILIVKKISAASNDVIVSGFTLTIQNSVIAFQSTGSAWQMISATPGNVAL